MWVIVVLIFKFINVWYVQNWISKVIWVGNINYLIEVWCVGIYGMLRMLVFLCKDGIIKEVVVFQFLGSMVLDDVVICIVCMVVLFVFFLDVMGEKVDELEII